MSRTDRLRVGIVGCGVVAGYGHGPALAASESTELVAAYDPMPGAAKEFVARFDGRAFQDEEAFYATTMDAIVVASPLGTHRHHVLRAAESGFHVLCEKPIAETVEAADEMARAMIRARRVLAVGLVYRHSIVTSTLLDWIGSGSLGNVRLVRMNYLWNLHGRYEEAPDGSWIESTRWRGRMEEGGPLIDCGVHFIDLARLFLGEIQAISGFGSFLADYQSPDHILATAEHDRGRSIIEVGFSYGHTARDAASLFTYDVIGTGGTARYDRDGWVLERRDGAGTHRVGGGSEKDFAAMHEAFARRIRGDSEPMLATAADARAATAWAIRATEDAIRRAKSSRTEPEAPARRNSPAPFGEEFGIVCAVDGGNTDTPSATHRGNPYG